MPPTFYDQGHNKNLKTFETLEIIDRFLRFWQRFAPRGFKAI
jgi:hypothetical protein